MDFIKKKFC